VTWKLTPATVQCHIFITYARSRLQFFLTL
jgi:hypothetical protein